MSIILLDRDVVHYEVLGRGRPLVFIHGWVGSWRYWIPVMQAASISYRAYAIDLWGFGDTAKNPRRYSLDEQVKLLDHFMDEMGIGRVALVGHGLGAIVARLFAARNPDLVDRVFAISTPSSENALSARLRGSTPPALADWLLDREPENEPVRMDASKTDPQAVSASLDQMSLVNFSKLWSLNGTACLMVHGQNDPAVTAPGSEQVSVLPEQSHAILFEESGHFPMLDETSKFNRLMIDFLALRSGETPRDLSLKEEWKRRVR